jgi:hypothetical protein
VVLVHQAISLTPDRVISGRPIWSIRGLPVIPLQGQQPRLSAGCLYVVKLPPMNARTPRRRASSAPDRIGPTAPSTSARAKNTAIVSAQISTGNVSLTVRCAELASPRR